MLFTAAQYFGQFFSKFADGQCCLMLHHQCCGVIGPQRGPRVFSSYLIKAYIIFVSTENRITASYTCDVFNKVTLEKQAKGTLYSFNISSKERNQGRNLDQILVYISNEMKKEDHSVTHPVLSKHKVSRSGCFHVKTDASNTITHGKPVG